MISKNLIQYVRKIYHKLDHNCGISWRGLGLKLSLLAYLNILKFNRNASFHVQVQISFINKLERDNQIYDEQSTKFAGLIATKLSRFVFFSFRSCTITTID